MSLLPPALVRLIDAQFRPLANIFELAIALAWALVGVAYLTDSGTALSSPLEQDAAGFDIVWSVMYIAALPLIWVGCLKPWPHWRVAGLLLLGTGLLLHGVIALDHNGTDPRVWVYWVYAVAVLLRAAVVVRYFGTKKGT